MVLSSILCSKLLCAAIRVFISVSAFTFSVPGDVLIAGVSELDKVVEFADEDGLSKVDGLGAVGLITPEVAVCCGSDTPLPKALIVPNATAFIKSTLLMVSTSVDNLSRPVNDDIT